MDATWRANSAAGAERINGVWVVPGQGEGGYIPYDTAEKIGNYWYTRKPKSEQNDPSRKSPSRRSISPINRNMPKTTKRSKRSLPAGNRNVINRVSRAKTFGTPSIVSTAPVNIGNTIRGQSTRVVQGRDSCTLYGRDFMFTPMGTGTIETWTLSGGAPLTPAAFQDSTLRQYMQMYNKFKFRSITAHYLTSSPTSADGDVLFYYNKNRESTFITQTSNNLLPFVISDPNTVLGPQWQNHSATFQVTSDWKSTDYGMTDDLQLYAAGDLFLLTRSTTTDSPGYVLFDYVIEFKEKGVIPRLLSLPMAKILWTNVPLQVGGTATVDTPVLFSVGGTKLDGSAASVPSGSNFGDVYKVIIDRTNSSFGNNPNTFLTFNMPSNSSLVTTNAAMLDGTTLYALYSGNFWALFPTITAAFAATRIVSFSSSAVLTTSTVQTWMSYVGTNTGNALQPNM